MKTKIVVDKGTAVHEGGIKPSHWAGELYREDQKRKMSLVPYGTVLSIRRGTSAMKLSAYPEVPKIISLKGFVISTARGTATRIL
ncbi:MAG: hypothetical protein ACT4N1_03750 [Nitrososphaerota archaeon]